MQNDKLPSLPKNAMPLAMVAVEMDKEVMYVHKYTNPDPTPHLLDSSSTSVLRNTSAKITKKAKSQSAMQRWVVQGDTVISQFLVSVAQCTLHSLT